MNIEFTCEAVLHITKLLKESPRSVGFRVGVKKTGCSGLAYDLSLPEAVSPGDQSYLISNMCIIVNDVDKSVLEGLRVDFVVEKLQSQLVFINPNESARCGCGESFVV